MCSLQVSYQSRTCFCGAMFDSSYDNWYCYYCQLKFNNLVLFRYGTLSVLHRDLFSPTDNLDHLSDEFQSGMKINRFIRRRMFIRKMLNLNPT